MVMIAEIAPAKSPSERAMTVRYELIIFDCDGVLIDSEIISTETLRRTLAAHGLDVDIAYVRKTYLGRAMAVVKSDYRRLTGLDLPAAFEADFHSRLFAAYRDGLLPMPGVAALIRALRVATAWRRAAALSARPCRSK